MKTNNKAKFEIYYYVGLRLKLRGHPKETIIHKENNIYKSMYIDKEIVSPNFLSTKMEPILK